MSHARANSISAAPRGGTVTDAQTAAAKSSRAACCDPNNTAPFFQVFFPLQSVRTLVIGAFVKCLHPYFNVHILLCGFIIIKGCLLRYFNETRNRVISVLTSSWPQMTRFREFSPKFSRVLRTVRIKRHLVSHGDTVLRQNTKAPFSWLHKSYNYINLFADHPPFDTLIGWETVILNHV